MRNTVKIAFIATIALGSMAVAGCTSPPGGGGGGNTPTPGCFEVDILPGTLIRHKVEGTRYWVYADGSCTTTPVNGPFSLIYTPNFTTTEQEVQDYCDVLNQPGTTTGYHAGAAWVPEQRGWMTCLPI